MSNHDITWFGFGKEDSPDVRTGRGSVEDVVSHLDVVRDALGKEAKEIARQAEIFLESAPAHRTGDSSIKILRPPETDLDWKVYLEDPSDPENGPYFAALSIENGHYVYAGDSDNEFHPDFGQEGRAWVPGVAPIRRAVELAIKRGKSVT